MYARKIEPLLLELLTEFRIIYLTGPRQAGKSTLVRSIASSTHMDYITLDNHTTLAAVQNDPHGFIQSMSEKNVILDEFQYAPELIYAIKEALPGHMARLELYPLALSELQSSATNVIDYLLADDFQYQQTPVSKREEIAALILQGGYPEIQTKSPRGKQAWFHSYSEGRLWKDFEALYAARGDYHSKLRALVPYLAGLSGNLLKYANVANDLCLDDKVIKSYIEILDLMFIIKRTPAYLKNKSKRKATTLSKLPMIDTGLASYLLGLHTPEQMLLSQYYGGLLANFIAMELYKQASWANNFVEIYHFRDARQKEVDLILEQQNGQIVGIEIKASSTVNVSDFSGLMSLAEFAGDRLQRGVLFYSGREILPFKIAEHQFYALPIGLLTQL